MEEKKEEVTGTLRKDKTLLRDEKKMEKLKQKLHTDDEREQICTKGFGKGGVGKAAIHSSFTQHPLCKTLHYTVVATMLVLWCTGLSCLLGSQHSVSVSLCVLTTVTIRFSTSATGKATDNGPAAWVSAAPVRDPAGAPGFGLAWPSWCRHLV